MTAISGSYTLNVGILGAGQTSCFLNNNFDSDSVAFKKACKSMPGVDAFCRKDLPTYLPPLAPTTVNGSAG